MFRKLGFASFSLGVVAFVFTFQFAHAQAVDAGQHRRALITENIDEGKLVTLKGNTRQEANAENDRGVVADHFPLEHMLLQLQSPPELEKALVQFIDELHNPDSPNFHKWLTAEQFGERFGLAQQDLDTNTTLSAADSTSNSNTSAITSTTAATGQMDGGASFNGSTSRIDISGTVNNSMSSYTVETWLNRGTTQPTGYGTFISRHPSGGGNQYFLVISGGTVYRWDGFPATQTISANAWHHVVYTYDGTTERSYIDGAAAGSNVATLRWDPDSWRFGMNTGGDHEYSGLMDEVRISNAVVPPTGSRPNTTTRAAL